MSKIIRMERVTSWGRALNAARRTIGKRPLDREPSKSWEAKMLLAEHSPIRLVEFEWTWQDIKQWITVHLVRHHEGCEKFVHSQREDRRNLIIPRDKLEQGSLNDMDMTANAQALINISKVRLCMKASKETRRAWRQVIDAVREIDPVMADKCVPSCVYRGFCPEMEGCGYDKTNEFQEVLKQYRKTDYEN